MEQETRRLIKNAEDLGYKQASTFIIGFDEDTDYLKRYDVDRVVVWGKEKFRQSLEASQRQKDRKEDIHSESNPKGSEQAKSSEMFVETVTFALEALNNLLHQPVPKSRLERIKHRMGTIREREAVQSLQPDILVVDSLNILAEDQRSYFFEQFQMAVSSSSKMVIFILDSGTQEDVHKIWEYACDVVIHMGHTPVDTVNDYYLRTIEVVKARYQSHVWGKHQLKIYKKPTEDKKESQEEIGRAHPFRTEGGIFIYPSIHYYLSLYKRRGHFKEPVFASTKPEELHDILKGLPEGRCTAFIGCRGGHKSHLGYVHLLHRILDNEQEAALIISLRDDEKMTCDTIQKILAAEFKTSKETPSTLQESDKLEILYYHPGYITPEEFFHRMFISIHRLKHTGRKLTVLFNSLDQLSSRFPLCAKQEIFVPGIVEALSGEGATSILIAVDESGQPAEQYGLLPMADLVLSFYPYRFEAVDYNGHIDEAWHARQSFADTATDESSSRRPDSVSNPKEAIVLKVERFAGGQQSGARGLLELVEEPGPSLENEAKLRFTKLSPKYKVGDYLVGRPPHPIELKA